MKKAKLIALAAISMLSVVSCTEQVHPYAENLDAYVKEMEYHDGFTILQLTDIHWSTGTDQVSSRGYMTKLINEVKSHAGKIDLIELTGDLFMLGKQDNVLDFLSWIESLEIPYATTWGNHDREGVYNPTWLSEQFLNAEHSLYTEIDYDDVYGRSNYVINLKAGDEVKWQLAQLDSGAAYCEDGASFFRTYDYIRESQTAWWKAEHDKVGADVPVIAYYHIPQWENEMAWDEIEAGASYKNAFFRHEGFGSCELHNSDFFDVAKDNGLKGAFMGHAHAIDWTVDYKGVTLGLGVKSNLELYYTTITAEEAAPYGVDQDFDAIGASLVTLHDDGNFDLDHLYLNERANGDFTLWLRY